MDTQTSYTFPREGYVSAKEIAAFFKIGISTWWLWARTKDIESVKFGTRTTRWKAEDVRRLAEELETRQGVKK